jgi:hypothetical protein
MLKNGKTLEEDEIVFDCLKKGSQGLLNQLHKLLNTIWKQKRDTRSMPYIHIIACPHKRKHHGI